MSRKQLLTRWCRLSKESIVHIVTDDLQYQIAKAIENGINNKCEIIDYSEYDSLSEKISQLSENDLLIVLLSFKTYMEAGANKRFSPFEKPVKTMAKYIFIRLDITEESLFQGLSTPKNLVYSKISEMNLFNPQNMLSVKNSSGTNITLKIGSFNTCSHEVTKNCDYAFLPPSETSADVIEGTANGEIVVDVTVGQFYYYGRLLNEFGLVNSPIKIIIRNGYVTDILGESMAKELKELLFSLPKECRKLVEIGQGLSKMTPTGIIGVDESIIDTCHFGIGDAEKCGLHLDVVVSKPLIQEYK